NLIILMAKDENELQHMVYTATQYDGPIAVRFPRGNGFGVEMDEELQMIPIGKWEVLEEGADVAILSFGPTLQTVLKATEQLKRARSLARVIKARSIKPLDEEMLIELGAEYIPLVIVEEAALQGGFGSAVLEYMSFNRFNILVERIGIPDL